ncbi:myocardin-related transcription factor A-like [Polymixia lowei]
MEIHLRDGPSADGSAPSPQSEAVANELQELSLQPAASLLPIRERKNVLQLKLQQRRTREELVNQGIMPPLKSSAAFHEQRRSLERARTEDYLKRKIRSRPERSELIRMHILEETSAEPSLQAKQLQLKRARLADDLNDKISHRPGPMELIHKNILPVHSSIKQAIIETDFPKASAENSSFDEDSNDSLSPEQVGGESPLGLGPLSSPSVTLAPSSVPSPTQFLNQVPPPAPPLPTVSGPSSSSLKLTNGTAAATAQRAAASPQIKSQPKPNTDRSAQRPKKPKDSKPKIKKLKYHQYIPPDQKADKEPPLQLDSSYAKILQQQQLFLQLQILNQQQQHYNYHTILPAPPKPQTDQQPPAPSCSSSSSTPTAAPSPPSAAPSTAPSNQSAQSRQSSAPAAGGKPVSLPPNLDEMKVAELKSELKLRSLTVSGTKNDLIERLRAYQELNGGGRGAGGGTTSAPTAGGATGPGAGGTGGTSKNSNTNNNTSQQQQQQLHYQLSPLALQPDDTGGSVSLVNPAKAPPKQVMTFGSTGSSPPASPAPSYHSPAGTSPEDASYNSDVFGEMVTSPLTQLSLQPSSATIKEEPSSSVPAPCQFSARPSPLQKRRLVSSTVSGTPAATNKGPVGSAMDKDKMLQEKDKQIEELTRMLRQKQRLVEALRMQLEHGKRAAGGGGGGGKEVTQPAVLLRVKEEPPDVPDIPLSSPPFASVHPRSPAPPPPLPCEMGNVKQEAVESGEAVSETPMLTSPHSEGLLQSFPQTKKVPEQILLQIRPEQISAQKQQLQQKQQQQQQLRLQQTALQLAQQKAIQKLLLQQQQNIQNHNQMIQNQQNLQNHRQNLQKRSQQRKKKSHKQQLKQQQQQQLLQSQQQQQQQPSKQQQIQLKQQILLRQQQLLLQQHGEQPRPQQATQQQKEQQHIQIQTNIQLKQQQLLQAKQHLLIQQKLQAQQLQQSQQVSQVFLNQQPGSTRSFPLDLLKTGSTPTLVTDSNGNHFLIALTNHTTENQGTDASENKVTNRITLQRLQSTPTKPPVQSPPPLANADSQSQERTQMGSLKQQNRNVQKAGLQMSTDQSQQGVAQSFSATPGLQPSFLDKERAPSGRDALSPPSLTEEVYPGLDHDALFSPLSPASVKTATSSPGDKENPGHIDDLFDILFQTGEISSSFKPAPDPSLAHLHTNSLLPSPPSSPLQLVLSPPSPSDSNTPQPPLSARDEPQTPVTTTTPTTTEPQQLNNRGSGRLEDFLESTTGKPLLGVEPGGLLTLIDDLHSQMLSTPSILDHPPSPMDTCDLGYAPVAPPGVLGFGEQGLDSMDWLDLTMGERVSEETPTLAPLAPQTPASVFSTDFLDTDLHIHWDSCL